MFTKPRNPSHEPEGDEPDPDDAHQHHATYEIADFAALSESAVILLVTRAEQEAAAGLPTCAHLVVTRDLSTGIVSHHVPCGSGLEALTLAQQVVGETRAAEPQRAFTVTVTPLLPHEA